MRRSAWSRAVRSGGSPRRGPSPWGAAVIVALSLAAARPAHAGDPRADSRAAFLRGVDEAHHDHFTAARDAFLEAYRLFPHPSILLNLGVARMHTGEYVAAEADLLRFLTDDGGAGPDDLANARATLQVVRKHIGTLALRVTPSTARSTLDGTPLTLTSDGVASAVMGPGQLHVEAEGYAPFDREVVVAHEPAAPIEVRLVRTAPLTGAAGGTGAASAHRRTIGWSLVGAAAAATAIGAVAGVEALALAHDYDTPGIPGYQASSTKSQGIAWRTSADVLFVAAIGLAATGTYFLVTPAGGSHDVSLVVGPLVAGLRGTF